jgi:FAD-linked oxidoreductase
MHSATWRNWSGSVRSTPADIATPKSEPELATTIARARKVRVVGAGHSFTPLCDTDGTLVSLSELRDSLGEVAADNTVWAPAGWSLKLLTQALWDKGYSLPNQGDINLQSLAGAISTGTHGTGKDLPCLSAIAHGFRLMLADGSILECDRARRPDLFEAQRLSLGLLGVLLRIRIAVLPAYRLEERIEKMHLGEVIERFDDLAATHRHAEFFVFPYSVHAFVKTLHPTEDTGPFRKESASSQQVFRFCCETTSIFPKVAGHLQKVMMSGVRSSRRVGPAYQIFPSQRTVRFEEMEYELPRPAGFPALLEAIAWTRKWKLPIAFPFEFRWVAPDNMWLSPFNRGPTAAISMHQYARMPWQEIFRQAEPIFRRYGGRPHWGKQHSLSADDVLHLYPNAARFREIRASLDPTAKFANEHCRRLFGIA